MQDKSWRFRPLSAHRAIIGESPFVSLDAARVWWVDTAGQRLFLIDIETGQTEVWTLPEQIGFVVELGDQVILGMQSGLFRFDRSASPSFIPNTGPGAGMRFNDACVDADGELWAGTMDLEAERPTGCLYRIGQDFVMTEVATGFRRINGLAHDAANARIMVSDSHPDVRTIWTLDAANGSDRRVLARMTPDQGRPDGAVIDNAGRYWVASLEGGTLFSPETGRTEASEIKLPVRFPTKAALGKDGRLYITSKSDDGDQLGGLLLLGTST